MRSVGNFHPEWGHLYAPSSFSHSLLVATVAIAVGATASAAVVLSLGNNSLKEANVPSISARAPSVVLALEPDSATPDRPAAMDSPAPAWAETKADRGTGAAATERGPRVAVHIEREARDREHRGLSRRKARWWPLARLFAPSPRFRTLSAY